MLTSRARQRIEEDFVITLAGRYHGLGRVIDVLRLITEMKIQQARHANPLTLLPGNVPIQQCLTRLLQQKREALICYVDIDNFKPFNDLYGYAKGDEVLLCLAHCLNESVDPSCDFVGHIGGDDFLLVLTSTDWERRIEQLLQEFHRRCRLFYRSEHLAAGCFIASSREGHEQRYPLLALSIGAAGCARRTSNSWMPAGSPHWPPTPSDRPSRKAARAFISSTRPICRQRATNQASRPVPCRRLCPRDVLPGVGRVCRGCCVQQPDVRAIAPGRLALSAARPNRHERVGFRRYAPASTYGLSPSALSG